MADEDPWGADDSTEDTQQITGGGGGGAASTIGGIASSSAAAAGGGGGGDGDGGFGDVLPEAEVPSQDDANYRRPLQLYKHWVRPKFLQYKYMYDYRTNYYDDVIDYLDKRSRGLNREVPRPQYWAERVLRTHVNPSALEYYSTQKKEDKHLIQTLAASIKTHNYHTRAYINRKYSSVL